MRHNAYIILVILGVFISLPLLAPGISPGHDYIFHTYRYKSLVDALQAGQIIPQVDPNMLGGFGYSWNMFYGPLSAYIVGVLRLLLGGWVAAIDVFSSLTVIFSGIFLYRFLHEVTGKKWLALSAGVLYMFAPYHLVDIYIREAQGEIVPFVFAPLILHGLYRILHDYKAKYGVAMLAIGAAGTILSHNLSAIILCLFALGFTLLNARKITLAKLYKLALAGILTICAAAFFILPLIELKATNIYSVFDTKFAETYMSRSVNALEERSLGVSRLLFNRSPVTGGGYEVMPFAVGMAFLVGVAFFVIYRKLIPAKERALALQMFALSAIALVATTRFIPWRFMPSFLYDMQFPWRFLVISTLGLSIACGISLYYGLSSVRIKKAPEFAFVTIATMALISSADIMAFATFNATKKDTLSFDYSLSKSPTDNRIHWVGQYSPYALVKNTNDGSSNKLAGGLVINNLYRLDQSLPRTTSGDSNVMTGYVKNGLSTSFVASDNIHTVSIELPLTYYPGYSSKLKLSDGTIKRLSTTAGSNGLVQVTIPAHLSGTVTTDFGMSTYTKIGAIITLATIATCSAYLYKTRRKV